MYFYFYFYTLTYCKPTGTNHTKATDPASLSQEAAAHGHASFTIDFDTLAPGKVTVKDRGGAKVWYDTSTLPQLEIEFEIEIELVCHISTYTH